MADRDDIPYSPRQGGIQPKLFPIQTVDDQVTVVGSTPNKPEVACGETGRVEETIGLFPRRWQHLREMSLQPQVPRFTCVSGVPKNHGADVGSERAYEGFAEEY